MLTMTSTFLTLLLFSVAFIAAAEDFNHDKDPIPVNRAFKDYEKADFWFQRGLQELIDHHNKLLNSGFPPLDTNRRIIFIGDGHGVTSMTTGRKYKQELENATFYENQLVTDKFPFSGFAKTYNVDYVVPDSAGTATAYLCGTKTNKGYIGIDATASLTCENEDGYVNSIADLAVSHGKVAGFVTTAPVTHASPAPLYAHIPYRNYQYNSTLNAQRYPGCVDIAQQFVKNARHIKVALGGGRDYFLPRNRSAGWDESGKRDDNRNLIKEWIADRSDVASNVDFVTNIEELEKVDHGNTDYLLGLFSATDLPFYDGITYNESIPRLKDMVEAAIKVLNENKHGYYLFVEGARIDKGHHLGVAKLALREGIEFDIAIQKALDMVNLEETLIVVSADHSHTLTYGGYLTHEESVFSVTGDIADDRKNYTSLLYANGVGAKWTLRPIRPKRRPNVDQEKATKPMYQQQALIPLESETHGGEDVSVFAVGPYSELFTGVHEQNYLAWAMACAAGLVHFPYSVCPDTWGSP